MRYAAPNSVVLMKLRWFLHWISYHASVSTHTRQPQGPFALYLGPGMPRKKSESLFSTTPLPAGSFSEYPCPIVPFFDLIHRLTLDYCSLPLVPQPTRLVLARSGTHPPYATLEHPMTPNVHRIPVYDWASREGPTTYHNFRMTRSVLWSEPRPRPKRRRHQFAT